MSTSADEGRMSRFEAVLDGAEKPRVPARGTGGRPELQQSDPQAERPTAERPAAGRSPRSEESPWRFRPSARPWMPHPRGLQGAGFGERETKRCPSTVARS